MALGAETTHTQDPIPGLQQDIHIGICLIRVIGTCKNTILVASGHSITAYNAATPIKILQHLRNPKRLLRDPKWLMGSGKG